MKFFKRRKPAKGSLWDLNSAELLESWAQMFEAHVYVDPGDDRDESLMKIKALKEGAAAIRKNTP